MFSNFFSEIDCMFEEDMFLMQMQLGRETESNLPAANVSETATVYTIELAVPGMKRDDFEIEVDENKLSVCCQKEEDIKEDKDNYKRREYNFSSFCRSFRMPEAIVT